MTMDAEPPTLAALLTPMAPGAIAVIGLAGPRTEAILGRVVRRASGGGGGGVGDAQQVAEVDVRPQRMVGGAHPTGWAERRPTLSKVMNGDAVLDDAVVVRIRRGELAVAEICTHGGVRIAQRALAVLAREGATIVSGAAFVELAQESDPVERAVDREMLRSGSRRMTEWLLAQRRMLPSFLDGPEALSEEERAGFIERSRVAIRLLEGIHLAVVGPPNAGKSTLANLLIGSDRVITSDHPGTTRDWVTETALVCGWPLTLIDTAGVRETSCEIEGEAIRRTGEQAGRADLVLILLDATAPPESQRVALEELVRKLPADRGHCVALNKFDLPTAAAGVMQACRISARTGEGVDLLERTMASMLGLDLLADGLPTAILRGQLDECIITPGISS